MNVVHPSSYLSSQQLQRSNYMASRPHSYSVPESTTDNVRKPMAKVARLKEVCDNCSGAKVRCDRDKAGCHRCRERGMECVYSVSRRVGRRRGIQKRTESISATVNWASSPSSPMDCTESDDSPSTTCLHIPGEALDSATMDTSCLWSFDQSAKDNVAQFSLDNGMYSMQDYDLTQPFLFPIEPPSSVPVAPMGMKETRPASMKTGLKERKPIHHGQPPSLVTEESTINFSRSSSSSDSLSTESDLKSYGNQIENVYEELLGLTTFAVAMEHRFDEVVRQYMNCRSSASSDFSPTPKESNPAKSDDGIIGSLPRSRHGPGHLESAYYNALAELRRRLKWLGEDVGNIMKPRLAQPHNGGIIYSAGPTLL